MARNWAAIWVSRAAAAGPGSGSAEQRFSASRARMVPSARPKVPSTPASLWAAAWAASCCSMESWWAARAALADSRIPTRSSSSGRNWTHRRLRAAVRAGCPAGSVMGFRDSVPGIIAESESMYLESKLVEWPAAASHWEDSLQGHAYSGPALFPPQRAGDLLGERQRVKGLEENGLNAEVGEALLIGALHLGGEQQDGDVGGGGIAAQFAEGCGAVHAGHHDVEENGVGLVLDGAGQALGAGVGHHDLPAGHALKAELDNLADVCLVVDDQDAAGHDCKPRFSAGESAQSGIGDSRLRG